MLEWGMGGGDQFDPPPCGFSETAFSTEMAKPCFFVTFNVIIRHFLSENLIKVPQVVQKMLRFSSQ